MLLSSILHRHQSRVFLLKLIPGMDPEFLSWIGEHYDAVIIESYGVGGLPSVEHKDFLKAVDKLIADGKIVVMSTQVMYEEAIWRSMRSDMLQKNVMV